MSCVDALAVGPPLEEEGVDVVAVTDVGAVTGAGAGLVVVVVGFVSASACDSGVDDDDVVVVVVGLLWFPAASDCCNCADIIFILFFPFLSWFG